MTAATAARHHPLASEYLTQRPWLGLYGKFCRSAAAEDLDSVELAPVQRLPDEILINILGRLDAVALATASCASRTFAVLIRKPSGILWRGVCADSFPETRSELSRIVDEEYRGNWREMFLTRPRLRCDGIYVSRNQYVKPGQTVWDERNPVHLVAWFRYLRFFRDGSFAYRTSPLKPAAVVKSLRRGRAEQARAGEGSLDVYHGMAELRGWLTHTAFSYPGPAPSSVHQWMRLRSTVRGACNRLDIRGIFSLSAFEEAPPVPPEDDPVWDSELGLRDRDAWDAGDILLHSRGLTSYVFVHENDVAQSVLNLGTDKLDYWIP
eukprot:CAMPEP_0170157204 /NCGR_PEP_ID=MMETSP0033_2-20121228/65219_1 /TAXON_ID=195969 /ORGANISM="Dolichomastix tenuilepis, Strain CCMP3274" /LENGTH=321 /DNA_ID=CAMNT_0010394597 /DNA_START=18 /DNA_END=980 /DNA_ORIENTATION=-